MSNKQNGLALRQQLQALTTETDPSVKAAGFSLSHAVGVIESQQAADIAFEQIKGDSRAGDFLADQAMLAPNFRAFLERIQKRIARAHGKC